MRLLLAQGGSWPSRIAMVTVEGRGPGVRADLRERIVEPFYRLPGASEREGGGARFVVTLAL